MKPPAPTPGQINLKEDIDPVTPDQYKEAIDTLQKKQLSIAITMRLAADKIISDLEKKAHVLNDKLNTMIENRPDAHPFLSTKEELEHYENWKNEASVTSAEQQNIYEHVESAKSGKIFEEQNANIEKLSLRQAQDQMPQEMKVISQFEADKLIDDLSVKLDKIDRDIDKHNEASNKSELAKSLKQRSRILNKLKNNVAIQDRLSPSSRSVVTNALDTTKGDILKLKGKSLERAR